MQPTPTAENTFIEIYRAAPAFPPAEEPCRAKRTDAIITALAAATLPAAATAGAAYWAWLELEKAYATNIMTSTTWLSMGAVSGGVIFTLFALYVGANVGYKISGSVRPSAVQQEGKVRETGKFWGISGLFISYD